VFAARAHARTVARLTLPTVRNSGTPFFRHKKIQFVASQKNKQTVPSFWIGQVVFQKQQQRQITSIALLVCGSWSGAETTRRSS
jgi:hypothetical protein